MQNTPSMPYEKPFYLCREHWGNALLVPAWTDVKLRIAPVINGVWNDVRLGSEIAFVGEENGKTVSANGLENFVRTDIEGIPVTVFDNHNHAFFFWYEARSKWYVRNGATLVHIDMHSDLWENQNVLRAEESCDLGKVWEFANYSCNVGNYVRPAMDEWLIGEMIRIEGEEDLFRAKNRQIGPNSILNLDLDIFAKELDDIDFELKRTVIRQFASRVSCITVATSPFFIPGERAIGYLKRVFE